MAYSAVVGIHVSGVGLGMQSGESFPSCRPFPEGEKEPASCSPHGGAMSPDRMRQDSSGPPSLPPERPLLPTCTPPRLTMSVAGSGRPVGGLRPNRPFAQEGGGNPVDGLRNEEAFSDRVRGRFSNR